MYPKSTIEIAELSYQSDDDDDGDDDGELFLFYG